MKKRRNRGNLLTLTSTGIRDRAASNMVSPTHGNQESEPPFLTLEILRQLGRIVSQVKRGSKASTAEVISRDQPNQAQRAQVLLARVAVRILTKEKQKNRERNK